MLKRFCDVCGAALTDQKRPDVVTVTIKMPERTTQDGDVFQPSIILDFGREDLCDTDKAAILAEFHEALKAVS